MFEVVDGAPEWRIRDVEDAAERLVHFELFVGGAQTPSIQQAIREPSKLMSLARSDAYPRRFPWISKLTLPAGTIDLGLNIPDRDVHMLGTKAMRATRSGRPPIQHGSPVDAIAACVAAIGD